MKLLNKLKLAIITIIIFGISSCANKKKDNFDFSNFKPPIRNSGIVKDNYQDNVEIKVKNKLLSLKKREEISSNIKYGKENPFAFESDDSNYLLSSLIFKGFILTSDEKYALIKYLGEEGTITENSIGGVNTKYLPNGAKVKFFNFSDSEITILFDDQEFTISINDQT